MQEQHQHDMAILTESLVQVGQRVDTLATDVAGQIQTLITMMHMLMAHVGITPLVQVQASAIPQPAFQPSFTTTVETPVHRNGSGSRSPRRDGEDLGHSDGIPDLPATFSFEAPGA